MKILLKILCAPMIAVLSVFVWLASKLVQISAVVMNFIAIAVGLGALCILFDGKTAQGICGLIAAFLFTPVRTADVLHHASGTGAEIPLLDSGQRVRITELVAKLAQSELY